jgi:phage-related protein
MELQEIEVTIDKKGQVKVHVRGVKGKQCLDLTKDLEKVLGAQVVAREMTAEALDAANGNQIDQTVPNKH